jgi:hypothetical protein
MTQYNLEYLTEIADIEEYNMMNYGQKRIVSIIDSRITNKKQNFAFFLFPLLYSTCFITGSMVFLYKIINV